MVDRSESGRLIFLAEPDTPESFREFMASLMKYFGATPTPFINESIVVEGLDSGVTHVVQPSDANYSKLEQDRKA